MYVDLEVEGKDPFFWTNLEYPPCHLEGKKIINKKKSFLLF